MKHSALRSSSGQVAVEFILLAAVGILVATLIAKTIRQETLLAQMVQGPWQYLTGMIENGVWGTSEKTRLQHPNYLRRHVSLKGQSE